MSDYSSLLDESFLSGLEVQGKHAVQTQLFFHFSAITTLKPGMLAQTTGEGD